MIYSWKDSYSSVFILFFVGYSSDRMFFEFGFTVFSFEDLLVVTRGIILPFFNADILF